LSIRKRAFFEQSAEPSGLSLAKLTQTLPVLWGEQRELFGFAAH